MTSNYSLPDARSYFAAQDKKAKHERALRIALSICLPIGVAAIFFCWAVITFGLLPE
jgi:hypothetical protein